jgi:hypothetical protein
MEIIMNKLYRCIQSDQQNKTNQECYLIFCFIETFLLA